VKFWLLLVISRNTMSSACGGDEHVSIVDDMIVLDGAINDPNLHMLVPRNSLPYTVTVDSPETGPRVGYIS